MTIDDIVETSDARIVTHRQGFDGNSGRAIEHAFYVEVMENRTVQIRNTFNDKIMPTELIMDRQDVLEWLRHVRNLFCGYSTQTPLEEQVESLSDVLQETSQRITLLEENCKESILAMEKKIAERAPNTNTRPFMAPYKVKDLRNPEWPRICQFGA